MTIASPMQASRLAPPTTTTPSRSSLNSPQRPTTTRLLLPHRILSWAPGRKVRASKMPLGAGHRADPADRGLEDGMDGLALTKTKSKRVDDHHLAKLVAEENANRSKFPRLPRLESWELLEKMGDGAFSNVYRARDRRGLVGDVAIKVVRKFQMNTSQVSEQPPLPLPSAVKPFPPSLLPPFLLFFSFCFFSFANSRRGIHTATGRRASTSGFKPKMPKAAEVRKFLYFFLSFCHVSAAFLCFFSFLFFFRFPPSCPNLEMYSDPISSKRSRSCANSTTPTSSSL